MSDKYFAENNNHQYKENQTYNFQLKSETEQKINDLLKAHGLCLQIKDCLNSFDLHLKQENTLN